MYVCMYVCTYVRMYVCVYTYIHTYICIYIYIYDYMSVLRGWRNMVGNLIETFCSPKSYRGLQFIGTSLKHGGVRFIEFEISNSTTANFHTKNSQTKNL